GQLRAADRIYDTRVLRPDRVAVGWRAKTCRNGEHVLSYELRIWDPSRHAPLPASAGDALDLMERLPATSDTRNPTLEKFGASLVQCYEDGLTDSREPGGLEAFWGSDPRAATAACRTAVYQLSIPFDEPTRQICAVVHAAAGHGLVVVDD